MYYVTASEAQPINRIITKETNVTLLEKKYGNHSRLKELPGGPNYRFNGWHESYRGLGWQSGESTRQLATSVAFND